MRLASPRSILITGASSGIGAALAQYYARSGVSLWLGGRDAARLAAVAEGCRAAGAETEPAVVDVVDGEAMRGWIERAQAARPLDLVIVNAGVSAGSGGRPESEGQARRVFAVNLTGALNTFYPAAECMVRRGQGQIALMSSLAGFRGLPGAPAYCASKAALRSFGEAQRPDLARAGIALSVICPGYIATAMTANNRFWMPGLMSADRAAAIIARSLARGRARIAFPWPLAAATWLLAALPPAWVDHAVARLPRRGP